MAGPVENEARARLRELAFKYGLANKADEAASSPSDVWAGGAGVHLPPPSTPPALPSRGGAARPAVWLCKEK